MLSNKADVNWQKQYWCYCIKADTNNDKNSDVHMMKQTDLHQCLRLWKLCSHKIFWAHFGNNAQYCNLRMSFDSCIILIKWYLFSLFLAHWYSHFFFMQHLDYLDYVTQFPWILSLSLWAIEETLRTFIIHLCQQSTILNLAI